MKIDLTIGICAYNEEKNIGTLLNQIFSFAINISFEVIVVSSGSTDKTNEIVRKFPQVVLVLEEVRSGKIAGLQKIVNAANGKILILLDADVHIVQETISSIWSAISNGKKACTARVRCLPISNRFMLRLSELSCEAWHSLRKNASEISAFIYPSGHLLAVERTLLVDIFTNNLIVNDDAFIALTLLEKGIVFEYSSDAVVFIRPPSTVLDFLKQKIRTRFGRIQLENQSHLLNYTENQWRRHVKKEAKRMFILGQILLTFDLIARKIALAAFKLGIGNRHHLWQQIKSTK